jgi:endonuclease III
LKASDGGKAGLKKAHRLTPAYSVKGWPYHNQFSPKNLFAQIFPWLSLNAMVKMTKSEIHEAFTRFETANPDPRGELHYSNNFTLLVAVVLSAQATDVGVNKATKALFAIADTPVKMLALGIDKLKAHIKTIGLYNMKAKNVMALSQILFEDHASQVPDQRDALIKLPGVGRKTANVVLNIAFGQPTCAVDTHIFRVGNRTGMAPGKNPLEVERALMKVIPEAFALHAHHWLILHGRYICVARKPKCPECPIIDLCRFKGKLTL